MPTAGPSYQVLALINPGALSQNKLGWSGGQAKHSPANNTAASLGLTQAPELVRPALPGSLWRKRRRRRVEMQTLEEEPESLGQGRAKQAGRGGNGVEELCAGL